MHTGLIVALIGVVVGLLSVGGAALGMTNMDLDDGCLAGSFMLTALASISFLAAAGGVVWWVIEKIC